MYHILIERPLIKLANDINNIIMGKRILLKNSENLRKQFPTE